MQVWPLAHWRLQPPQLNVSIDVSTQPWGQHI